MNTIKNIPLSLIYFFLATLILISVPFVFEFDFGFESNVKQLSYSYKLATPQKDTSITNLGLHSIAIVHKDSIHLKQYIADISTDGQIHLSFGWGFIYIFICFLHMVIFRAVMETSGGDALYIKNCKYLPTKSKMFYYNVDTENRTIRVYKLDFIFLEKEKEYKLDISENLTQKMFEISKELDTKYMSYETEELKNWRK